MFRYLPLVLVTLMFLLIACEGSAGPAGPQGSLGIQGVQGEPGAQGVPGLRGKEGARGSSGERGDQGDQGPPGVPGERGPQGEQGTHGELGQVGPQGERGPRGKLGQVGPQGPGGEQGPVGLQGRVGAPGSSANVDQLRREVNELKLEVEFHGALAAIPDLDFEDWLWRERDAVVAIFTRGSSGSGVRISNTEILTAQHVTGTQPSVRVSVRGVGLVEGIVKGYDKARDIALITFEGGGGETAELTTIHPQIGSEVAAIGYVRSISETTPVTTFGRIGVIWNIVPGNYTQGQMDAAATHGMSGGPVFNSNGTLVGIVQSGGDFEGDYRFLMASEIGEVIEDLRAGMKQ